MRNHSETWTAIRLSLLYAVGAGLWILSSDRFLTLFISDPHQLTAWQTTKGWLFVAVTTLLLYFLLEHELRKRGRVEESLRAGEERYRLLTELTSDWIYAFRLDDGRINREWTTETFTRLTGFDPADLDAIDNGWLAIIHPDDRPVVVRRMENLMAGRIDVSEYRLITAQGKVLWVCDRGRPLRDERTGTVVRIYGAAQDITKRKQTEAALQEAHTDLEQRVADRTQSLTTLTDQLETLLAVQQAITRRLDPEDVLQLIADEARRLTATRLSMVYLLEGDTLRIAVFSGQPGPEITVGYQVPVGRSGAGLSIRSGQPVLVHDAQHDSRLYGDAMRRLDMDNYMTVPLLSTTQAIGVIAVADKLRGQLDATDERLVTSLASGAVIALENARLYRAEQERRQALEALYHADEELYRHLHTDQVLRSLVDVAIDMLQGDKSAALVWDAGRERLVVHTARGFRLENFESMTFSLTEDPVGEVAANGEPVLVEDAGHTPWTAKRIIEAEGICSFVHVPIKIKAQIFGVFNISYTQPRLFGHEDRRLFTALGRRAALAIENARLYEQAQKSAALEERQRLARDLHDAVTQNLFSTTLITEVLPQIWDSDPAEGRRLLRDLRLLSRGALAEMRTLLLELRPAALATASLSDLLRQLADAVMGRKGIPVIVTVAGECDPPIEARRALYRIAQEALNNVAKHAQASQVVISLRCAPTSGSDSEGKQPSGLALHISDDGQGFDPSRVSSEHLGLAIMRERAEAVGAVLEIDSAPGAGAQVRVGWGREVRVVTGE